MKSSLFFAIRFPAKFVHRALQFFFTHPDFIIKDVGLSQLLLKLAKLIFYSEFKHCHVFNYVLAVLYKRKVSTEYEICRCFPLPPEVCI